MFSRHPASDSSKLRQFVSFDVWVNSFFVFNALLTEFCNCACAKKIGMLIRIRHTCVALIHKKTVLSLETIPEINFEFIEFVKKKVKCLALTKQIGNIKYLVIFDLSRFSITFLHLPNQVDLSAHCSYHFSTSNVLRLRCNNTLIFLWRFQCWNFKLGQFDEKPAFLGCFSKRSTHILSDLVGSGFLKALAVRFLFKFVTWKLDPCHI